MGNYQLIIMVLIQTSDLPPNNLGEFSLLLLLLGDEGHVIQEGIHLCKCEGAGLAWGHERALLKECLGRLCHISLAEQSSTLGGVHRWLTVRIGTIVNVS